MGVLRVLILIATVLVYHETSAMPGVPVGVIDSNPAAANLTLYEFPDKDVGIDDNDILPKQPKTSLTRNWPGMPSFPDRNDFYSLIAKLSNSSEYISTLDKRYGEMAMMRNIRVIREPYTIFAVMTPYDVREVLLFCKKHNVMVSIQSSGHSYIGRSTCDGCIQINMRGMKKRVVNLNSNRSPAGEITVETGNQWLEVYEEVDKIKTMVNGKETGRVIVGGSAHTVAMGGYTQGGGHSPMARKFGLAVDNLLEATIVTVDGRILTVSADGYSAIELDGSITHSNDSDIFWAIRGGGGGTWGVITSFTFKLHYAPERFRMVSADWALQAYGADAFGRDTLKYGLQTVNKLCGDWGGYFLVGGEDLAPGVKGRLSIFFNHAGSDDDCSKMIDAFLNYNVTFNQYRRSDKRVSSFLNYEMNAHDPEYITGYIVNSFVQRDSITDNAKLEILVDQLMKLDKVDAGCTGAMIGGQVSQVPVGATPVNPNFRSALLSLSCGNGWDAGKMANDSKKIDIIRKLGLNLRTLSDGVYFNECDEDLADWKTQFWGTMDNYCKLKAIKNKVDPDNFLWCHNCVGSDLSQDDCTDAGGFKPVVG